MAKRRNKHEDDHQLPLPPPPYEVASVQGNQRPQVSAAPFDQQQETIPKVTISQAMSPENQHHYDNQPGSSSAQMSFAKSTNNGRKNSRYDRPTSAAEQQARFVESLTAPKGFFRTITVEPVAFIAMLALYIEFPAIQDLIYTKICLEVVANHPNLTYPTNSRMWSENGNPFGQNNLTISPYGRINSQASQSGRIQSGQPNGTIEMSLNQLIRPPNQFNTINSYHDSRDHFLCDRLNRTAIPRELRQEILEIDSLFWLKYQLIVCTLCAICSPYWGGISDKIGRLVPLNVAIGADALCNLISLIFGILISMNSHTLFHLNWLFVGAVIVGLSGGQGVLITNLFGFISDNTTSEERTKRVTVLEAVICISHSSGFFLNKLIMSLGLANQDKLYLNRHFVAFSVSMLLSIICILVSVLRLRHHKCHRFLNNFEREQQEAAIIGTMNSDEMSGNSNDNPQGASMRNKKGPRETSGAGERMRELTSSTPDDLDGSAGRLNKNDTVWSALTTIKYYKQTYLAAMKPRESRSIILLLLLSGFISAMSLTTLMSLLFIYLKMDPFNWTTSQYSSWNSWTSISRGLAVVGLSICMRTIPGWNVPDPLVAAVGFLSKGAGLLMIGLAQSSSLVNWSLLAFVFSEYSMPPIRSLLSKLVVREELGKIYSCFGSLQSICFILGNIVFYIAFTSLESQDFFRLSFIVVAAIEFSTVLIMLIVYSLLRRRVVIL